MEDRYLGDGVYASFDGFQIWLDLRGQGSPCRIALEPGAFRSLLQFSADIKAEQEQPVIHGESDSNGD